jgi:hypothetical protein
VSPRLKDSSPACKDSTEKPNNFQFTSLLYGSCKAEFYTEKSYIRKQEPESKKWTLIIGTQHPKHWFVIASLAKLVENGASEEELVKEREALQAEDVD